MLVDPGDRPLSCEGHCFVFVHKRQMEFHLVHVFGGNAIAFWPINTGIADDISSRINARRVGGVEDAVSGPEAGTPAPTTLAGLILSRAEDDTQYVVKARSIRSCGDVLPMSSGYEHD